MLKLKKQNEIFFTYLADTAEQARAESIPSRLRSLEVCESWPPKPGSAIHGSL